MFNPNPVVPTTLAVRRQAYLDFRGPFASRTGPPAADTETGGTVARNAAAANAMATPMSNAADRSQSSALEDTMTLLNIADFEETAKAFTFSLLNFMLDVLSLFIYLVVIQARFT